MRFFAIGFKGWTEIRKSKVPPKPHESSVTTTVNINRSRFEWDQRMYGGAGGYRHRNVSKPKEVVLTSTTYAGGRVVKTLKSTRFTKISNLVVKPGGIAELTPEIVEKVLKEDTGWQKPMKPEELS